MYRVNPLMRNVLITTDEVIFHAPTQHTLDPKMIEHSIIIAEERFIRPALGFDFYEALKTEKNLLITSGNQAAQQILLEASMGTQPEGVEFPTLAEGDIVNAWEYLSEANIELWKEVLWKFTAEAVMVLAFPEAFVQFSSAGTIHNQPASGPMNTSGIVTPELRSVKWAMDKKLMERIEPMRQSLHLWLCKKQKEDSAAYEDYTKDCACNEDGVAFKRKSDFILGIYDDDDDPNCC